MQHSRHLFFETPQKEGGGVCISVVEYTFNTIAARVELSEDLYCVFVLYVYRALFQISL